MKYLKHTTTKHLMTGAVLPEKMFLFYKREGFDDEHIPDDPMNMDYVRMMAEVDAGTSTIEEVDDSIVLTYADKRRAAYPDIGDQLDDLYHQATFSDEMAAKLKAVKDANPKG